jgi:5-guanidino-2-oxopentanoate decarboxylase
MRNVRTFGEAIVALLEAYGVDTVFGIPGVHTLELYRGLVNSPIRHVLPRHEQGAGFMADGYARTTGRPGVCFLITGPGLTNAATPIAQAYSDSVPMLVISSVNPAPTLGRGLGELHELADQQKLMSACTAFSVTIRRPEEFPQALARAFALFASGRPRPVHIEVPIDIFEEKVDTEWQPEPLPAPLRLDTWQAEEAAKILAKAERPVIIAGGGARHAGGFVREIAETVSAPVALTVAGIGILPGSHGLCLGPTLVSQATRDMINGGDAVLAVGTELASTDTWGGALDLAGRLVRIDVDANQFEHPRRADLAIKADAREALSAIAQALGRIEVRGGTGRRESMEAMVADAGATWRAGFGEGDRQRAAVFEAIVGAVPQDTIFTADMTQIAYTAHTIFRPEVPGRFFYPQGYGTLGYALPAALGVKIGAPGRPVVALVGDGGILYTLQEMATAAEEGLGIVVVLWNNNSLKQIREGFIERGIRPIAVDPQNPDFHQVARGFGWKTEKVAALTQVGPVVAAAVATGQPTLVEIDANALGI